MLVFLSLFGLTMLGCYEEEPPAGSESVHQTDDSLDDVDHDNDGYTEAEGDCDDTRADVFPGAVEICWDDDPELPAGKLIPIDKNCDGDDFEGALDAFLAYPDTDADGFGDDDGEVSVCVLETGFVTNGDDCDDTLASVNPQRKEVCDDLDNDCNGYVDDSPDIGGKVYFLDDDGDGYGNVERFTVACEGRQTSHYVENAGDCDDTNIDIHPGAFEVCDGGVDNNCSGLADDDEIPEALLPSWYADVDGDLWGGEWLSTSCDPPEGVAYTGTPGDCNDANADISPWAAEVCDGINNDCDLETDEDVTSTFYADVDEDGFGDPSTALEACEAPAGWITDNDDCNDADASIYPGALEIVADEIDSDCDAGEICYIDADDDGVTDGLGLTIESADSDCQDSMETTTVEGDDCDDSNALVGSIETDADCDGAVTDADCDDTDATSTTLAIDADCDGTLMETDCDDGDDTLGAAEDDGDCDGVLTDDDCNDGDDTSTTVATDADCDGVVTADDCDDAVTTLGAVALDADCDAVVTAEDCDDSNALLGATALDVDCDGVLTAEDCDDAVAALGAVALDADCDGVLTDDDCDDAVATLGAVALDADCDGVLTDDDCNDGDNSSTTVATDADCDGVLTADDCDDGNDTSTTVATDADCDGVLTDDDCDDAVATLGAVALDADCDGVLTDDDCDDGNDTSTTVATDADCDGVLTDDDCDDGNDTSTTVATDADCDGALTAEDCDDDDNTRSPDFDEIIDSAVDENCDGYAAVTCDGDVNDEEVEGCGIVTGNASIDNTDWTDLSLIVALEQVDGTLSVFNNHSLEHLDHLTGLRSAGTVDLQENHALTDVTGLNGLESLDELRIYNHDSLTDLNLFNEGSAVTQLASLTVDDLAVVDLDDFNGITEIGYQLIIENNALLTDISGLANLESINDDVPECTDDDPMCEMMGPSSEFTIRYNDSMTDIDGFASLTSVDATTMNITHNDSLEDVSGFANLATSKAAISLSANPSLTTVSGFESLTTIDQFLSIESNNVLVDINGFNALETGGLWIQNGSALVEVTGFASLTTITSAGLNIQYNPVLRSFAGLANVTTSEGGVSIVNNTNLLNLDGLAGLTSVTSTQVRLNYSLCQSFVDDYVAGITYDSLGTVTGNLDGC